MENTTFQLLMIIALVLLTLLILILWFRTKPKKDQLIEEERPGDGLSLTTTPAFQFNGVDAALSEKLRDVINKMGGVGDDAERNYQEALTAIRPNATETINAIEGELEALPTERYLDRWSLIQLLAELKDPASLSLLDKILSKPMPKELYADPHKRSSLREETINLTTAVDAVTRIAANDNQDSLQLLFKHAQHESLSVRRASIQGFIEFGGQDALGKLREILPKNDHYLLDIKRTDIRKIKPIQITDEEVPKWYTSKTDDHPRVVPQRD